MASATTTATVGGPLEDLATANFSLLQDIIRAHILPRLDGCTLASVGCTTPDLYSLASDQDLWSHICQSTWPSTATPRVHHLVSSFPNGPRSFFSLSYPSFPSQLPVNPHPPSLPELLISAVDIFYRGKCIFSRVHEMETVSGWFKCSSFRVDLLGPKETVSTPMRKPSDQDDTCRDLIGDLEVSWIVVDPGAKRAVNVSSIKAVAVERHWLTGEVHVRYAAVAGHVMCEVLVTCAGGGEGDVMHATEVSLKMDDVDGAQLNGRDSLVILQRALRGKRGNKRDKRREEEEVKKRYLEYLERKRERREKRLKREEGLDMICVVFGVSIFILVFYFICFSN